MKFRSERLLPLDGSSKKWINMCDEERAALVYIAREFLYTDEDHTRPGCCTHCRHGFGMKLC